MELGIARCSLESIVNHGRDYDGALEVCNSKGTVVGELACSVGALAAFGVKEEPVTSRRRGAEARTESAAGSRRSAAVSEPLPEVTVKMTKLTLNADGQHLPGKPRTR